MYKKLVTVTAILTIFLFPIYKINFGQEKKEYMFVAYTPRTISALGGKAAAQWREMIDGTKESLEKKWGVSIGAKVVTSLRVLSQEFKNKKADFSTLTQFDYIILKDAGTPIEPLATFSTSDKKEGGKVCLWVNKNSNIKNLKDLKGRTLGIASIPIIPKKGEDLIGKGVYYGSLIDWIYLRKILKNNGFDIPVDKFFHLQFIPNYESILYAVLFNKVGAGVAPIYTHYFMVRQDKNFKKLKPIYCVENLVESPLIVCRMGLDKEIDKETVNRAKNSPKISEVERIIKELGIKIFEVSDSDYNIYRKWLKEAETQGWLEEIKAYQEYIERIQKEAEKYKKEQ